MFGNFSFVIIFSELGNSCYKESSCHRFQRQMSTPPMSELSIAAGHVMQIYEFLCTATGSCNSNIKFCTIFRYRPKHIY